MEDDCDKCREKCWDPVSCDNCGLILCMVCNGGAVDNACPVCEPGQGTMRQ